MTEILYKNLTSQKNHRRAISVSERSDKKGYLTHVHKVFIYVIEKEVDKADELSEPVFHIVKCRDTKEKKERCYFRVKGFFYLMQQHKFLKVHFCHSLKIDINQKTSPAIR